MQKVRNGKWSLDFAPNKRHGRCALLPKANGQWTRHSPASTTSRQRADSINRIAGKGTLLGDSMNFPQVEFKGLEGTGTTGRSKIDFKGWL